MWLLPAEVLPRTHSGPSADSPLVLRPHQCHPGDCVRPLPRGEPIPTRDPALYLPVDRDHHSAHRDLEVQVFLPGPHR